MRVQPRAAGLDDLEACLELRSACLARFCEAYPAEARWCPAGAPVPRIEDEETLRKHLAKDSEGRWAVLASRAGEPQAYLLCRTDQAKRQLSIEWHSPRVSPLACLQEEGGRLVSFVIRLSRRRGVRHISAFLHGPPDEVEALVSLYRGLGFEGDPRLEMLTRRLRLPPGRHRLRFRSAQEVGLDTFYGIDAAVRNWSREESEENAEISWRMWSVDPATDWLVAYEGENLVGTVQVALTRQGVGVVDHIGVLPEHRGRGLGRCLLTRALAALRERTDVVWLDVDQDNLPAVRLYQWAGFRVHHLHGGMVRRMESA